jgi:transcriptional regulator with XRE-family HTH domain
MGLKASLNKRRRGFASQVRELRKASKLTQVEVAERLGTDQSTYSKIEKGIRRMDVVEFTVWAEIVGVDPADVLAKLRRGTNR